MPHPIIRRYTDAAGGWGALQATGNALAEQGLAIQGTPTLPPYAHDAQSGTPAAKATPVRIIAETVLPA